MLAFVIAGVAGSSVMQPSGKWIVEFAENACVLSRRYGEERDPTYFHLKAPMLGDVFEVLIVVPKPNDGNSQTYDEGWIERPDGSKAATIYASSYITVNKSRMTRISLGPEKYVLGEDGERVIFHVNKRRKYDLALTGYRKAKGVLDECLVGLRHQHGVGEDVTGQIVTEAKSEISIVNYFNSDDYPSEALMSGQQGYVGALFWVETDGRVRECKIVESSHRQALDNRTCEIIMRRTRFTPALDGQGKPVRSPQYQRIRWEMPD